MTIKWDIIDKKVKLNIFKLAQLCIVGNGDLIAKNKQQKTPCVIRVTYTTTSIICCSSIQYVLLNPKKTKWLL